ncbi:MAG: NUDIX hydrolase [Chloroflexota bacterium]
MAKPDSHPQYPRVAVGALVMFEDKVLLVKRGKPPASGVWALPGGRVEWGESLIQAVQREVIEETGINIEVGKIIYTFDSITRNDQGGIAFHYIIIDFLAHPVEPVSEPVADDDADDAAWLTLDQINALPMSQTSLALIKKYIDSKPSA